MEEVRALLGGGELGASCVPGGQHRLASTRRNRAPDRCLSSLQMGRSRRGMAMRIRNLRHPCTIPNLHRFAPPKVFRGASSAARHVPCAAPPPRPPPLYRCTAPCAGPTIRPSIGVLHLTSPGAPTWPRPPPLTGVPAPPHHPTRPPLVLAVQMGRCRGVEDREENGSGGLLPN